MSDPADDRMLQDYLARKSALSLGYKRLYIETPPPELDKAITARARRALRWLVPGILAAAIMLTFVVGLNVGVGKWVDMLVSAERKVKTLEKERKEQEERERLEAPVAVMVDANDLHRSAPVIVDANAGKAQPQLSREAWLKKIEELKKTGSAGQVEAELKRFHQAYPDKK